MHNSEIFRLKRHPKIKFIMKRRKMEPNYLALLIENSIA